MLAFHPEVLLRVSVGGKFTTLRALLMLRMLQRSCQPLSLKITNKINNLKNTKIIWNGILHDHRFCPRAFCTTVCGSAQRPQQ
jgi:hypothetical protein